MSATRTNARQSPPNFSDWAKGIATRVHPTKRTILLSDLWIQTKGDDNHPPQLVRFEPNTVQRAYLDQFLPDWQNGNLDPTGIREIVLKARQFGFSTLICALFFLRAVNTTDRNVVVIADESTNTEELFAKYRMFWENLPADIKPRTQYNNVRQLYFPDLRSRIKVLTAGKKNAGRSQTIHDLHCSEVPHWENPAILTGLLQAVPRNGNVFLESTAKGEDAVFCEQFRQAEQGKTPYQPRFFAWWQHDEYEVQPPPSDFTRTDEETTIANKYALDTLFGKLRTNAKLLWRRRKKSEPGMGSLIAQEYPGDAKEAFLVSGKRFFTEWDPARHLFTLNETELRRTWHYFGGYDWGIGAPACFLLACIDERGCVRIIDEIYGANRTTPTQAADVKDCLKKWDLHPQNTPIYADPSMWTIKRDITTGANIQQVLAFLQAGLHFIPAGNDRVDGWANVKLYLHNDHTETNKDDQETRTPVLQIARSCTNLIRTQPLMVVAQKNTEDADTEAEDHAWDTLRYLLSARPRPAKPLHPKPTYQSPREKRQKQQARESL